MNQGALTPIAPAEHDRPSPARSPRRRVGLGTRLAISVALSVAAVVSLLTVVAVYITARQLESDLRETARVTAVAVADEIELRQQPITPEEFLPILRDFINAATDLRSISVFGATTDGVALLVSTSALSPVPVETAEQVISTAEPSWTASTPGAAVITVPVRRDTAVTGAVAVVVTLASITQLQRSAGLVSLAVVVLAMAGVTLLMHLLAKRLILGPLEDIRQVMAKAHAGDLTVRVNRLGNDELSEVGEGLNAMLSRLYDLNRSLNERVTAATTELRERNEQLVRSYESILRLRETLARAEQLAAVGQTMANVAHQIGTPLNLASGHVQLLRQEITEAPAQRRLQIVADQIERVVSTVRDLLQRATPHPERGPVDIGALLARLSDATRSRLTASRVSLDTNVAGRLPLVTANETELELALLNLMSNALDAMPTGGSLTLAAAPVTGGRLRIEITDTGAGITPDLLPTIFEPWVTTKSRGEGTGLGLSIARDVVSGLGGTIDVASEPGRGTTFTIELPGLEPREASA